MGKKAFPIVLSVLLIVSVFFFALALSGRPAPEAEATARPSAAGAVPETELPAPPTPVDMPTEESETAPASPSSSEEAAPSSDVLPGGELEVVPPTIPPRDPVPEETPASLFGEPVPASDPVPLEWFQDAVFVGDSITDRLRLYCSIHGSLGEAQFLCSTSLSPSNALAAVTEKSVHPEYEGRKRKVEDAIAACGAKNVYLLLGVNNMYLSVSKAAEAMEMLVRNILEKAPRVNILIQSVTPIASTSASITDNFNNAKVDEYNQAIQELCSRNGWYYLDIAAEFTDGNGFLIQKYCYDPNKLGIHLNNAGAQVWVDYLVTHVPEALK